MRQLTARIGEFGGKKGVSNFIVWDRRPYWGQGLVQARKFATDQRTTFEEGSRSLANVLSLHFFVNTVRHSRNFFVVKNYSLPLTTFTWRCSWHVEMRTRHFAEAAAKCFFSVQENPSNFAKTRLRAKRPANGSIFSAVIFGVTDQLTGLNFQNYYSFFIWFQIVSCKGSPQFYNASFGFPLRFTFAYSWHHFLSVPWLEKNKEGKKNLKTIFKT